MIPDDDDSTEGWDGAADEWLVRRARGGDVDAYEVLVRRHRLKRPLAPRKPGWHTGHDRGHDLCASPVSCVRPAGSTWQLADDQRAGITVIGASLVDLRRHIDEVAVPRLVGALELPALDTDVLLRLTTR